MMKSPFPLDGGRVGDGGDHPPFRRNQTDRRVTPTQPSPIEGEGV
jgi:hypothetical protein